MLLLTLSFGGCIETSTITRLDGGRGVHFIISADNEWEIARPYYYEVQQGGSTVISRTFVGVGDASGMVFEVRASADRRVLAVVESSAPDILLAIFDTTTSKSWPAADETEHNTTVQQRGIALLSRFQQSYPDADLVLGDDVPTDRNAKLQR